MSLDCPCGFGARWELDPFSAAWHRAHGAHHVAVFPDVDDGTRRNLDSFVADAERRALADGRVSL